MSVLSVAPATWRAAPEDVAVRTAGLPASVLHELSFGRTAERVRAVAESWRWLRGEGAALSDELYAVIRDLPDFEAATRPALVGLRRAVFTVCAPTDPTVLSTCRRLLPSALTDRVDAWFARFAIWRESRASLDDVLRREENAKRTVVREVCADPMFRHGLLLSSPQLLDLLDRWRAGDVDHLREGKLLKLVKYLTRASAKTSPFSALMAGWLTTWRNEGTAPTTPAKPRTVLEAPVSFVDDILDVLSAHPDLASRLHVRANPSLTVDGDTVSFVGRGRKEPLLSGQLAPVVSACLGHLAVEPEPTVSGLRASLAGNGLTEDEAHRLLGTLVARGLLQVSPPVDDNEVDPFGSLAAWLDGLPGGHWDAVRADLRALAVEFQADIPVGDVEGHRDRLGRVRAKANTLADRIGTARPPSLAHDSVVGTASSAAPDVHAWQDVLTDLDTLRRWLTLFDWKVPIRVSLGTWYRERFGAGTRTPLLVVYREVLANSTGADSAAARTLRSLLAPSATPWSLRLDDTGQERLRELRELREQARELVRDPTGATRHLDPHMLETGMRTWPGWLTTPDSAGFYVQSLPGEGPTAVVNTVHAGHGRATGRLRHLTARSGSPSPTAAPDIGLPHAELGGRFGSPLNVREASTRCEIEYPFSTSTRPRGRRIRPGELDVVHDPDTDLVHLWSPRLRSRVSPVHLGMQGELALPPLATFLERGFAPAYLFHPSVPPLISLDDLSTSEGVHQFPRVEVGTVVSQRARWVAPARDIPSRARHGSAASYLLALAEWRRGNGIPDRCYLRGWTPSRELGKDRKPLFVDFDSWYLTALFDQEVSSSDAVLLDEALPDPLGPEAPEHVTELYVQVSRKDGDHG